MTTKVVPGQLVAVASADQASAEAAARIAKALRNAIKMEGRATLALSGGSTPRVAYGLLAKETGLDWAKVEVFWVDERAVPETHERSNFKLAKETLLDAANIPADNVHRMHGDAKDLDQAAKDYEALVREVVTPGPDGSPAFDAVVLGIGDDGHTASLFPGEKAIEETARLVVAVPAKGDREARLTITPPAIEQANAVFVLATGSSKSNALDRAWSMEGSLKDTPARVIRGVRGAVTWIIDRAAGGISLSSSMKIKV
jgi:6-phosphogluconolactonase